MVAQIWVFILADADLIIVDDGAGGTNRKASLSRVATYIEGGISGDITISSGTVPIGSGVIVNADVNASAALEFSKMENLTVQETLVSDGNGDVSVSAVTSTEIGYSDGVSSAIQTQLDTKATNVRNRTSSSIRIILNSNTRKEQLWQSQILERH